MFFYCIVPVAPLRIEPSHRSEMVSQLLFGEAAEITERAPGGWAKIKCDWDGYEGWITASHLTADGFSAHWNYYLTDEWSNEIILNHNFMVVPLNAHIPQIGEVLATAKNKWEFKRVIASRHQKQSPEHLLAIARMYLNTPYLWGGKSVFGIDCSGLVQQVFKRAMLRLPRDAWQQAETGTTLHFLQEAQPCDVAFFDNEEGRIIHTGILLNDHSILHASGKVRIDAIDTDGIVNSDTGARTHHLRIIKRMISISDAL